MTNESYGTTKYIYGLWKKIAQHECYKTKTCNSSRKSKHQAEVKVLSGNLCYSSAEFVRKDMVFI